MKSHKRQKGWHAVTEQQQQGPRSGPGVANPSYVRPGRNSAANLSPEAFPGLGPGTSPATPTEQQPAPKVPQLAQSPLRAGPPPPAQGSAWQGPPAKAAKSPLPGHQANAQPPTQHITVNGDAVTQLVEVHPWAEPDLVEVRLCFELSSGTQHGSPPALLTLSSGALRFLSRPDTWLSCRLQPS